ncbi:hypothetical protein ABPG72_018305 [Tetrahymena utriculariae]
MSYSYLFKFIIIGDSSVGKSAILLQFMEGKFKAEHDTTIGVEFGSKIIQVKGKNVKLQVWDTVFRKSTEDILQKIENRQVDATNESLGIKIGPQLTEKMVSDTKKTKKECSC